MNDLSVVGAGSSVEQRSLSCSGSLDDRNPQIGLDRSACLVAPVVGCNLDVGVNDCNE